MTRRNHNGTDVADKTVLIPGANRGIGRALVIEAVRRGAKRVFAGSRGPLDTADERVTALTLDVTNASHEEIFPDPASASVAESWRAGAAKALERQFAAFVPENSASQG